MSPAPWLRALQIRVGASWLMVEESRSFSFNQHGRIACSLCTRTGTGRDRHARAS